MKKTLFSMLFLATTAFSFYQCQKDAPVQNVLSPEPTQQVLGDRGDPACAVTLYSNEGGNVCGTTTGTGSCTTCGNLNGVGSANFAGGQSYTFQPSTIIFSVRNNVADYAQYTISNVNGSYDFVLLEGECADFYLSGCDIIPL